MMAGMRLGLGGVLVFLAVTALAASPLEEARVLLSQGLAEQAAERLTIAIGTKRASRRGRRRRGLTLR